MGIDRWEQEHRNYRPGRPVAEVALDDRALDVPEELPVAPAAKAKAKSAPKAEARSEPRPELESDPKPARKPLPRGKAT